MKLQIALALCAGLGTCWSFAGEEKGNTEAPPKAEETVRPKTLKEQVSYTIGNNIGRNLKSQSIEVDMKLLLKGIQDGLAGGETLLTAQEMNEAMQTFQIILKEKQAKESKAKGEKNMKEGELFLAENKKKPGVQTTASGLQYIVIEQGTGEKPKATDTVVAHYRGTLIDGTEFDSSYSRGEPLTIRVGGVIKGWTEALQMMPVGSKWKLFIPSELAYGARGAGADIGPHATLIFDIELISIK